jgi:beta-glucosidase/6-phospho-beta-glucosidase/beta-galactosidase
MWSSRWNKKVNETFPEKFVWGTVAAADQIEGAWNEDGQDPSIRDVSCRKPSGIRKAKHPSMQGCSLI